MQGEIAVLGTDNLEPCPAQPAKDLRMAIGTMPLTRNSKVELAGHLYLRTHGMPDILYDNKDIAYACRVFLLNGNILLMGCEGGTLKAVAYQHLIIDAIKVIVQMGNTIELILDTNEHRSRNKELKRCDQG